MEPNSQQDIANETLVRESKTLKLKLREARKSEACLVIVLGKPLGKRFALSSKTMVIGRGSECEIPVPDNSLSRTHAQVLKKENGRFYVSDFNSTNGTYLNDQKLAPGKAIEVKNGDLLKMGNMIFKFIGKGKIDNVFHKDILYLASRDDLTGSLNRMSLRSCLADGLHKARTSGKPLSIIVLDLDHFKSINDTYGHAAGDFVLKETVKVAQNVIRGDDFIGRFGGDEFMVVLWDTSSAKASMVAERIRSKIEKHSFTYEGKRIPVTASLGVSSLDDSIQSIADLFKRADGAQYNAKKNGGNQVSLARIRSFLNSV
jgi:two-component system cell cycle response regulator